MPKAVLVMDMPKCCADCQLANDDPSGLYCMFADDYIGAHSGNCRRDQIIQSIVTMEGSMQGGTDA
ncbi:MAG: hypothetical protein BHV88_21510 [Clostridiales bacterium 41_12_two_minus]|nr:MAG: hypothetical protein BHV88_21510 [Clostridiales bacterium 41_12_two_minus]